MSCPTPDRTPRFCLPGDLCRGPRSSEGRGPLWTFVSNEGPGRSEGRKSESGKWGRVSNRAESAPEPEYQSPSVSGPGRKRGPSGREESRSKKSRDTTQIILIKTVSDVTPKLLYHLHSFETFGSGSRAQSTMTVGVSVVSGRRVHLPTGVSRVRGSPSSPL